MSQNIQGKLVSRNVTIEGHRTSLRLEIDAWSAFEEICKRECKSVHEMCTVIEEIRTGPSRTAAVRAFILAYFRSAANDDGHSLAGHGRLDQFDDKAQMATYLDGNSQVLVGA